MLTRCQKIESEPNMYLLTIEFNGNIHRLKLEKSQLRQHIETIDNEI